MKKIFFICIALCGFSMPAQNAKSLLWKISGNGLKQPSYVYGTIHITCDASLAQATKDALAKTSQLYLELDMDDPTIQTTMLQGVAMKDGQLMSKMSSKEDFEMLDKYIKEKTGISIVMLNNMKPALVSTMLLPSMLDCPMQSVESELMKEAKTHNEEVLGLETVQQQTAVFDAIPYQVQMDELIASVKGGFDKDKKELNDMYALYKTGDVDAMQKMTADSPSKITSDYQDVMLNDRNAAWAPKIASIAAQKPTFFAVGAAHLGGPKGVLELLRKLGFKVEPGN
jgi:uncharacterized protein YbaP (TraB family)